jgi:hypothetical protein
VRDGVGAIGAEGEPRRVIEVDGAEATDVPAAFVAVTVKVYGTPRLRPVTAIGEATPVAVAPFDAVTVYPVIADPPLELGAVNATLPEFGSASINIWSFHVAPSKFGLP